MQRQLDMTSSQLREETTSKAKLEEQIAALQRQLEDSEVNLQQHFAATDEDRQRVNQLETELADARHQCVLELQQAAHSEEIVQEKLRQSEGANAAVDTLNEQLSASLQLEETSVHEVSHPASSVWAEWLAHQAHTEIGRLKDQLTALHDETEKLSGAVLPASAA